MQPNIFFWDQTQSFQQESKERIYQIGEIIHEIITFLAHAENSKLNDEKRKVTQIYVLVECNYITHIHLSTHTCSN